MSGGDEQEFVIKNGSGNRGDVRIRAPISGTLLDLKKVLQAEYPGNPQPSGQTVCAIMHCPHASASAQVVLLWNVPSSIRRSTRSDVPSMHWNDARFQLIVECTAGFESMHAPVWLV